MVHAIDSRFSELSQKIDGHFGCTMGVAISLLATVLWKADLQAIESL